MLNHRPFDKQLMRVIRKKRIVVKYPKGYERWRKKFHATLRETNGNVPEALAKIHGKTPVESTTKT